MNSVPTKTSTEDYKVKSHPSKPASRSECGIFMTLLKKNFAFKSFLHLPFIPPPYAPPHGPRSQPRPPSQRHTGWPVLPAPMTAMKAPGDELLALVRQDGTVRLHHAGQGRDNPSFQQPLHPLHHKILLVLRKDIGKGLTPEQPPSCQLKPSLLGEQSNFSLGDRPEVCDSGCTKENLQIQASPPISPGADNLPLDAPPARAAWRILPVAPAPEPAPWCHSCWYSSPAQKPQNTR